jgi:hypothetical protein
LGDRDLPEGGLDLHHHLVHRLAAAFEGDEGLVAELLGGEVTGAEVEDAPGRASAGGEVFAFAGDLRVGERRAARDAVAGTRDRSLLRQ